MEVDFLSHFEKRLEEYCTPGLGPHFYFFQRDAESRFDRAGADRWKFRGFQIWEPKNGQQGGWYLLHTTVIFIR